MSPAAPPPGKSPVIAVLAALLLYFLPGAGQMYAGRLWRGLGFCLATYAGAMGLMYLCLSLLPSLPSWLAGGLLIGWWGFMAYDAYRCALASPPSIEDAARAAAAPGPDGAPPPPPAFEPASPALRWTWAATRWTILAFGGAFALLAVLGGVSSAREAARLGSTGAAAWALLVAGVGAGLLCWLGARGLRVYAAAVGSAPLPAEELGGEVRGFFSSALLVTGIFAFGLFVTQGIWRDLLRKSNDGATRGDLGELRRVVENVRAEESGLPPGSLDELVPRSLAALPKTKLSVSAFSRLHPDSNAVRAGAEPTDEGGWLYDGRAGTVRVNCTHTDAKASVWSEY